MIGLVEVRPANAMRKMLLNIYAQLYSGSRGMYFRLSFHVFVNEQRMLGRYEVRRCPNHTSHLKTKLIGILFI